MFFYLDNPVESIARRACAHNSRETESRPAAFFRTRSQLNRGRWRNCDESRGGKGERYLANKKLRDVLTGGRVPSSPSTHVTSYSKNTHEGCSEGFLRRKCQKWASKNAEEIFLTDLTFREQFLRNILRDVEKTI